MNGKRSFAVIGGDLRNMKLAEFLLEDEYSIKIFGFDDIEVKQKQVIAPMLEDAIRESDIVIGPVPCSNDSQTLNCAYSNQKIFINELFRLINKNQIFIAGRIDEKIKQMAEAFKVYCIDILDREEMAVLNAIPTVLSKSVQLLQCTS